MEDLKLYYLSFLAPKQRGNINCIKILYNNLLLSAAYKLDCVYASILVPYFKLQDILENAKCNLFILFTCYFLVFDILFLYFTLILCFETGSSLGGYLNLNMK